MTDWLHPALLFVGGALIMPLFKGRLLQGWLLLIPLLAIVTVANMTPGDFGTFEFAGVNVMIAKVDKLSLVFAWVFTIAAFIGCLYGIHIRSTPQHVATFLYVGSALVVVFAGDLFTLLVGWEIMAFASAYLIFATREGFVSFATKRGNRVYISVMPAED